MRVRPHLKSRAQLWEETRANGDQRKSHVTGKGTRVASRAEDVASEKPEGCGGSWRAGTMSGSGRHPSA